MAGGYALNIPKLVDINVIFDVLNNTFGNKSLSDFSKNVRKRYWSHLINFWGKLFRNWHYSGRLPLTGDNTLFKGALSTSVNGPLSSYANSFMSLGEIPSGPLDLKILTFLSSSYTSRGYNVGAGFDAGKNEGSLVVSRGLICDDTHKLQIDSIRHVFVVSSINSRNVHVKLSLVGIKH